MAKDPAVLFYCSDFLTGIAGLTMEERGQYITLLCLQHQQGHLSEKTIRLAVGSPSVDVLVKFQKDENGNFFNLRMEEETEKRRNFVKIKQINGKMGGRPKTKTKPIGKANNNLQANLPINENENRNENVIVFEKEVEKFKNDFRWKEKFCRDKNISLSDLERRMAEFISDTELREDFKELKELKSHFTNTFNKKNGHSGNSTGGKLGTSAARIEAARNF